MSDKPVQLPESMKSAELSQFGLRTAYVQPEAVFADNVYEGVWIHNDATAKGRPDADFCVKVHLIQDTPTEHPSIGVGLHPSGTSSSASLDYTGCADGKKFITEAPPPHSEYGQQLPPYQNQFDQLQMFPRMQKQRDLPVLDIIGIPKN